MRIALLTLLCALFTAGCDGGPMSGEPMPPFALSPDPAAFVFDVEAFDDDIDQTIILDPLLEDGVVIRDVGFVDLPAGSELDYGLYFARQWDADDPDDIGPQFIIEADGRVLFEEEYAPMVLYPGERLHLIVNLQLRDETAVGGQVYLDIGRDETTRYTVPIRAAGMQ